MRALREIAARFYPPKHADWRKREPSRELWKPDRSLGAFGRVPSCLERTRELLLLALLDLLASHAESTAVARLSAQSCLCDRPE